MYFLFFNPYNPKSSILLAPVLQMKKVKLLIFKIYLSIILFYNWGNGGLKKYDELSKA